MKNCFFSAKLVLRIRYGNWLLCIRSYSAKLMFRIRSAKLRALKPSQDLKYRDKVNGDLENPYIQNLRPNQNLFPTCYWNLSSLHRRRKHGLNLHPVVRGRRKQCFFYKQRHSRDFQCRLHTFHPSEYPQPSDYKLDSRRLLWRVFS